MRKTIITGNGYALAVEQPSEGHAWLDLTRIARVEMTSESADYPVEGAFANATPGSLPDRRGWRAHIAGPQTLILRFDEPQAVARVFLHFREAQQARMQEFSLYATLADGHKREIVRQQWSFSPEGATDELENYHVDLDKVIALTLWIDPDRGHNRYPATLEAFRVEA